MFFLYAVWLYFCLGVLSNSFVVEFVNKMSISKNKNFNLYKTFDQLLSKLKLSRFEINEKQKLKKRKYKFWFLKEKFSKVLDVLP